MKIYGKKKAYKYFLYGIIYVIVLLLVLTYITSRAKYRVTQSVELVRGKITSSNYDFELISMYVEDNKCNANTNKCKEVDGRIYKELGTDERIPNGSYEINEENSYCKKGTEEYNNKNLYTNEYGEHIISGLEKGSKCYLYFSHSSIPVT